VVGGGAAAREPDEARVHAAGQVRPYFAAALDRIESKIDRLFDRLESKADK